MCAAALPVPLLTAPEATAAGTAEAGRRGAGRGHTDTAVASTYTWRNVQIEGGGFVPGIVFHPTERGLVYARTDIGGAYRLDPDTDRWIPLLDHVSREDWNRNGVLSLATDPVDPDRVVLAVGMYTNDWDPNPGAILRSTDRGSTWEATELPFKVGGNMPGRGIGERLAIDPLDNATIHYGAEGDDGLWRSRDHGATWSKVTAFPGIGSYAPDPDSGNSYLTQRLGVLWTAFDPREAHPEGGCATVLTAVADPEHILYRSDDGGDTWAAVEGAPTGFLPHHGSIDASTGDLYLTTSDTAGPYDGADGEVWRYAIDDGTWTDITPRYRPVGTDFGFSGLALDPSSPGTLVVSTQIQWWPDILLFRSTDRGESWTPIWEYGTDSSGATTTTTRYRQDVDRAPWLTFGGEPTAPAPSVSPSPKLGWMVASFAIDPTDPDHALYGTGATIYRTRNLTAWDEPDGEVLIEAAAQGIEETAIQDLAVPQGGVDLLSAMLDLGGFVHQDIGTVPAMIDDVYLGGSTSVDIAGGAQEVFVRAGTDGEGVHRVALSRDAGTSWTAGAELAGTTGSGQVAITADARRLVWSAPGAGVQVSSDDGATWTPSAGIGEAERVEADRKDPQLVHAWAGGSLHVSRDAGTSFAPASRRAARTVRADGTVRMTPAPDAEGELWIAASGGTTGDGLSIVTAGGERATRVRGVDSAESVGFGAAAPGAQRVTVYLNGVVDGVHGFHRSTDAGRSWTRVNDDRHRYGNTGAAITGDPDLFGRVYVATDGRGIVVGEIGGDEA